MQINSNDSSNANNDSSNSSNANNDATGTPLKLPHLILVLLLDLVMHTFMERMVSVVAVVVLVIFIYIYIYIYITKGLFRLSIKNMPWKYNNL